MLLVMYLGLHGARSSQAASLDEWHSHSRLRPNHRQSYCRLGHSSGLGSNWEGILLHSRAPARRGRPWGEGRERGGGMEEGEGREMGVGRRREGREREKRRKEDGIKGEKRKGGGRKEG